MSPWRQAWLAPLTAARALRYNPDARPDARSERLAAVSVGLLVLAGAIGTYVAVVGGPVPLLNDPPAGGAEPTPDPATGTPAATAAR